MDERAYKQVIVWNNSLKVRKGKMCAQVAHASRLALLNAAHKSIVGPDLYGYPQCVCYEFPRDQSAAKWLESKFTTIVVKGHSADHLIEIEDQLVEYNKKEDSVFVSHALITDSGFTEFHGVPTITCLGIGPGPIEIIDLFTRHLELM